MKSLNFTSFLRVGVFMALILLLAQCEQDIFAPNDPNLVTSASKEKPDDGSEETAGNNLSFPVIWSDGFAKTVPGTLNMDPSLNGEWWYVWGVDPIDPQAELFSCKPNAQNENVCEDGSNPGGTTGTTVYRAYIQKDAQNTWQAYNDFPTDVVNVDRIDWGDNLESLAWTTRSQVRAEVVLLEDLNEPVREYAMRHVDSWGIDEVHGLQTDLNKVPIDDIEGLGTIATVYSHNARLTIQKLNVESLDELYEGSGETLQSKLEWIPTEGWTEDQSGGQDIEDLVNDVPLLNMAVYNAGDGPGYYNAEINVKGKIIYGYTWNVRELNEGEGYYRLTFSFDADGPYELNTYFDQATEIVVPIEEEEESEFVTKEEGPGNGGVAVIDVGNNLSYMDILITERSSGGGGGKGQGQGGSGSGGGKDTRGGRGSGSGSGNGNGNGSGSGSSNH